ncbi:hypothetical protein BDW74DRAFT_153061 [Aspergillus multicolor]|uniref:uncharacterized protein n=1 Tax=Aspergillus multicolor TaxID=41759 RepID=UPI003CCD8ABB
MMFLQKSRTHVLVLKLAYACAHQRLALSAQHQNRQQPRISVSPGCRTHRNVFSSASGWWLSLPSRPVFDHQQGESGISRILRR